MFIPYFKHDASGSPRTEDEPVCDVHSIAKQTIVTSESRGQRGLADHIRITNLKQHKTHLRPVSNVP